MGLMVRDMTESFQSQINNLWTVVPLGTVLISLESGKRPKGGVKDIKTGIPSLGGEHLNSDGGFKFENIRYIPEEFALNMLRGQIKQDDILIVKDGATTGKISFVNRDFPYSNAVVNEHVFICRISKFIDPKFIFYFLFSETGQKRILENFKGSAQGGINSSFSAETLISLAPLNEQKRIVNKIEELLSELDHAVESFKKIQKQLKIYRQAVLKAAFEGKLTKNFRRRALTKEDFSILQEEIHLKDKKLENDHDTEQLPLLFDIPETWTWVKLGKLLVSIEAGKSFKCDERPPLESEIGVAKVSAVSWGFYNENQSKTCIDKEKINLRYLIQEGDFLFSRANTIDLVGACVIANKVNLRIMLSDKTLRLNFSPNLNLKYPLYYLQSTFGRADICRLATGNQESMRNIGQDRIKKIQIPLMSLPEQNQIIQEIESRLSICDELEKTIEQNLILEKSLRQSILKKAFEGKLVPQDPNDEPAELLLEKIKLEKEKLAKLTNSSKTKTKREKVTA